MSVAQLVEATASTLSKKGNRWKVVLAKGGQQGSSGYYSEDVLREDGPAALPAGSKAFINHDPKRDPRDMFGFYPEGASYEEGVGLVAELEVFPHYKELVEHIAPHAGLSIYMMGEKDEDDNITRLLFDRTNSVDLVSFAGLEGSGITEKLYESARAASSKPGATAAPGEMEINMEIKDLVIAVEALTKSLALVVDFIAEQRTAADAAVAEAEAKAATAEQEKDAAIESYSAAVKAVAEAKLLPSQESEILAAAKAGQDIAPLVESAKKVIEEAKSAVAEKVDGYVIESKGRTSKGFALTGGSR